MVVKWEADSNENVIFRVPKGEFDLDKTFNCGQCFRWNKLNDGTYKGIVDGELILIKPVYDSTLLGSDIADNKFITNMRNAPVLFDYLGLYDNYTALNEIEMTDFEKKAVQYGRGIRILKQDLWEVIVSFIISQRNSIPKIKTTIEKMCKSIGQKRAAVWNDKEYYFYRFPKPIEILQAGVGKLQECGLGYRAEYVYNIADAYLSIGDMFQHMRANNIPNASILAYLEQYRGIGPKVANCILLFGYHRLNAFPIDVWIKRVIDNYYPDGLDSYRFGSLAGLMQQYMFYYVKHMEDGK